MPEKLPTDGVILLVDPLGTPNGAGFRVEKIVDMSKKSVYLAQEETHPILNNIEATNITVSRYLKVPMRVTRCSLSETTGMRRSP